MIRRIRIRKRRRTCQPSCIGRRRIPPGEKPTSRLWHTTDSSRMDPWTLTTKARKDSCSSQNQEERDAIFPMDGFSSEESNTQCAKPSLPLPTTASSTSVCIKLTKPCEGTPFGHYSIRMLLHSSGNVTTVNETSSVPAGQLDEPIPSKFPPALGSQLLSTSLDHSPYRTE